MELHVELESVVGTYVNHAVDHVDIAGKRQSSRRYRETGGRIRWAVRRDLRRGNQDVVRSECEYVRSARRNHGKDANDDRLLRGRGRIAQDRDGQWVSE